MRILLDTHTFIFFLFEPDSLSSRALEIIENNSEAYLSIDSVWEIAIKTSLDKLQLEFELSEIESILTKNRIYLLPIELSHTSRVAKLEWHHRDPFDRLIISQAIEEKLTLVSKDRHLKKYDGLNLAW